MSRYVMPGFNPYFPPCSTRSAYGADGQHPLLHHVLRSAPDRAEVLALLGNATPLAEEAALQQAGAHMFGLFVRDLPASYRARGQQLEAQFRIMLEQTQSLVMQARFAPGRSGAEKTVSGHAMVMAYVAVQHLVGARRMAMDLYGGR
ncbi:hypothetical protein [Acetobacter sp. LMG 32666]|uniref:hypothetical protein n=1 Tax=Acetobacter sp. LMG 32666 TaxID=2959295 RepID=UPI0030C8A884